MNYNKLIDHTHLKQNATKEDIIKLCKEAREHDFASVCVNPCFVPLCKEELKGSDVKVCTVIGFPLGATSTLAKAYEAKIAVEQGANEVDMVINVSALKGGNLDYVLKDIKAVVENSNGALVKVIIETCLLTDEEKVTACKLAKEAHADFVKTSTGFSTAGATKEDIKLMRETVGPDMGVKAAGGIRDFETMMDMVNNGANRIGTSGATKFLK